MSETTGTEAPAVASEAPQTAATPEGQTSTVETPVSDTASETEVKQPVVKTYTQEEYQDGLERATAKAAAKAERRAFREANELLQRTQQPVQRQQEEPVAPRAEGESDAAYVQRLVKAELGKVEQSQRQNVERAQAESLYNKTEKIYAEAEKIPGFDRDDFNALLNERTRGVAEALVDSDMAPKLMAYITSNPEEMTRLQALSPSRQAAEIGKLETKLSSQAVKPPKAPAPISTVGNGTASTVKNLATAGMDDFKKQMKAAGSRWIR